MSFELTGRGEFAELVTHHELRHVHGDEFIPVVYGEGVPNEIGTDRRATTPRLNHPFFTFSFIHANDLFLEVGSDVGTFFDRTSHIIFLFVCAVIIW